MARKSYTSKGTKGTSKTSKTTGKDWKAEAQERDAALKASIADAAAKLADELSNGASARLKALLDFGARFHQYSIHNQILILSQCPGATQVAGYKTWEGMGYHVNKGEHGIRIWAPRPYEREEEKDDGTTETKRGMYFVTVPVFDVSQLNPDELAAKPLPTFYTDMGSDEGAHELGHKAEAAIRGEGIRIVHSDTLPAGVQGVSSGGKIEMRRGLGHKNYLRTLIHEWAHELLHHDAATRADTTRSQRECHAEATAYIVCEHFGMHNDLSADYLTTWSVTPDKLLAELATVQRAASHIIEALSAKAAKAAQAA